MGRAQNSESADFATVHQFAHDKTRFDGFANAYVVGNEQAHRVQAQGHEQRYKLVSTWLDSDIAKGAKRPPARTQLEAQGIAHEQRSGVVAGVFGVWPGKSSVLDGGEFQLGNQGNGVFVRPAQGAQAQQAGSVVK